MFFLILVNLLRTESEVVGRVAEGHGAVKIVRRGWSKLEALDVMYNTVGACDGRGSLNAEALPDEEIRYRRDTPVRLKVEGRS